jgi:stage II sporulation protein AA (anti-sigma F factor antagonist)
VYGIFYFAKKGDGQTMATVTFSAAGETLYAYLAGEIDHDAAQSLRMQLDDALVSRSPRTLIIDLGGVGFMDSSGIGLILGRQRCARVLGMTLRLQHAPAQLQKVLRLAGIHCTENTEKENAQ